MTTYSAVLDPYHYPGGVIAVGESVELSDEDAARGLASGAIVVTPVASQDAPKTEETP